MKKHFTKRRLAAIITVVAAFLCAAFYNGLTVANYVVYSSKMDSPVRIVLLSDLHSHIYYKNQSSLVSLIKKQEPDLILLAGDIADDEIPIDGTLLLLDGIKDVADIYYVTGNHEYWSGSVEEIKELMQSRCAGFTILSDEYVQITVDDSTLVLAGVEDHARAHYSGITYDQVSSMREAFSELEEIDGFKILLAHRPERIERYKLYDFDLVLSGHSHGGQVRIPFILNGLFAPDQGWFPKYAGGVYEHDTLTHIVSRGLSCNPWLPRVFNPPEVVVIDLLPE